MGSFSPGGEFMHKKCKTRGPTADSALKEREEMKMRKEKFKEK